MPRQAGLDALNEVSFTAPWQRNCPCRGNAPPPSQASKGVKKTHQACLRKQSNLAQQSSVTKPPNLFVLVLTQICCGGREAKLGSGLELELELELEVARTGIC